MPRSTITRSLSLQPDLGNVARGRKFLSELALEAGFSEERVFDITVACSEAMANAIEHSQVKGEVQVRAVLWPDRLEVEVEGLGEFQTPDRLKERNTRGLGLPLMAKLSDHLALFSGPNGRTFVSLTFYRPGVRSEEAGPVPPSFADLARENKLLDDVLENLPDGFVVFDQEWRVAYANPAIWRGRDFAEEELFGRSIWENFPQAKAEVREALERSRAEKTVVTGTFLVSDGVTWHELTAFPLQDATALFVRDVTRRKQAEQKVQERDRLFEVMFDNGPQPMGLYEYVLGDQGDIVDLIFKEVNQAAVTLAGLPKDRLVGRRFLEVYSPELLARYAPTIQKYEQTNQPAIHEKAADFVEELGRYVTTTFVPVDDRHFVGVFADVTDAMRNVQANADAESLLGRALRHSSVALAAQDLDLRYTWAFNQKAVDSKELIGKTDAELLVPDEAELITALKRDVIEHGVERHEQFWVTQPGGRLYIDARYDPVLDEEGKVTGLLMTTIDMTEQRYVEEAFRRSEAQLQYLLELSDAVRPLDDAEEILAVAARVLGERLKADRVFYVESAPGEGRDSWTVKGEYLRECVRSTDEVFSLDSAPRSVVDALLAGRPVWSADVETDATIAAETEESAPVRDVRAFVEVPLVRQGQLVAVLKVHQLTPREWIQEDIDLATQTAGRTWSAVQRARAEAELRDRQRLLDLALQAGRVVPWEIDLRSGEVNKSPELFRLFGLEPGGGMKSRHDWRDTVLPEDRRGVFESVERARELGTEHHSEFRVQHPAGAIRWLESHGVPVADGDGEFVRLVGFVGDITERKTAEEALRTSEERHRALAEQLQAALLDMPGGLDA